MSKAIGAMVAVSFIALSVSAKPLNYLIVLGDDISSSSIGCYGSVNPNTSPNIDKLADEGIRFTNMFVANAVCGPTRAELYTGLQPYRNGCTSNHRPTKAGTLSVVQYLSELGYRVGLTGKRHFSPSSVYPFEKVKGFQGNCNARAPRTGETWDGVEEFMTRNPEQPFCLFICSIHAHAPWDAGDTSHWELGDLKLPPHMVDTQQTRHFFREHLGEVRLFDEQVGKAQALLKKLELDQDTAFIVLDENGTGMPGGKWTNYDWGVRSACIIKWPGISGFQTDALAEYCDIVPTLIDAAGGEVPANLDGRSMLPLITGKTKTHRDNAFFEYNSGGDGAPFSSRAVTDGRYKLMWNLTPDNLFAVRVINGFDYGYEDTRDPNRHVRMIYRSWLEKAITDPDAETLVQRYRKHPEFQLFDLDADPWEMNNLANNPEYTPQLQKLKAEISAWMKQQGDDGKEPERRSKKKVKQ